MVIDGLGNIGKDASSIRYKENVEEYTEESDKIDQLRPVSFDWKKNKVRDIGLIAVNRNYRGKRFGEMLVRHAQYWFINNGYNIGQVVTQGTNIPACNLYKKCGYSVEKVEYFYHFWL